MQSQKRDEKIERVVRMSFQNILGQKQASAQRGAVHHTGVYHQNLADLFRTRQMEKTIQQANRDIEQLRERLSRLEEAFAKRNAALEEIKVSGTIPATPPLPIAELKELAAMAKRFK